MIDSALTSQLDSDQAWRELSHRLRPFIARRVQSQSDVDDVLQDTFLRMQRSLHALQDEQRFGPWVYQITRSAIVDHHRISQRHPLTLSPASLEMAAEEEDEPRAVEQVVAAYAAFLVSMLPSPYREALTLTELEGLTQKEAARMLGVSLSGMKSRVQRGREKLRAALDDCCHIALDARRRVVNCEPRQAGAPADCSCSSPSAAVAASVEARRSTTGC